MALGACHGDSHPNRHGGVHPVDYGDVAEFLVVGASFIVGLGISVEGSGDQLIVGGFG